jgi:hypothetical protein
MASKTVPEPKTPTFSLLEVQQLARRGLVLLEWQVLNTIGRQGYQENDVQDCLCALTLSDFYKPVPSTHPKFLGEPLDVYKPLYRSKRMYLKFKLTESGQVFVLSFRRDKSS